jgi:hypothetical protein
VTLTRHLAGNCPGGNTGPPLLPGTYAAVLAVDGEDASCKPFTIVMDPKVKPTAVSETHPAVGPTSLFPKVLIDFLKGALIRSGDSAHGRANKRRELNVVAEKRQRGTGKLTHQPRVALHLQPSERGARGELVEPAGCAIQHILTNGQACERRRMR